MIGIFAVVLLAFVLAMIGMAVGILTGRRGLGAGCAAFRTATNDAPACEACGQPAGRGGCTGTALPSESEVTEA
ncbi:MAG: hypothetical protein Q8L53_17525 [Aestuariivirga sp.]|nr:hypothetical protein [Aestuariivirga sp.]